LSLRLYEVDGREITPIDETELKEDKIYIIIDTHAKRSKIWIWSGMKSNMMDRYFAGVSATKIKAKKKLYGASIEVVESGNEPEIFPKLSELEIILPEDEKFEEILLTEEESQLEEEISTVESIETEPNITESSSKPDLEQSDVIQKFKIFLNDLSEDMGRMQKKITNFLGEL